MVNAKQCVTCGHHERDHDDELGCCQRCTVSAGHRFLSPSEADKSLMLLGSDLMAAEEFVSVPAHIELQARLFALDMAMKAYDLVTEVLDDPPGIEWIDTAAERYVNFLLSRTRT